MTIRRGIINNIYRTFEGVTGEIQYWIDVQPEQFEIKIYTIKTVDEETTENVISWDIVKLEELKKKPGFSSQSFWTRVNSKVLPLLTNSEGVALPTVVDSSIIIDMFARTVVSKPAELTNISDTNTGSFWTIFVPDEDGDMTDFDIRVAVDVDYEDGYNIIGPSAADWVNTPIQVTEMISDITLSSAQTTVTTDSFIDVDVTSDVFIKEVFLEQVSGILNKARVSLTNGQGSFRVLTNGLQAGEQVRVKVGHKKWEGVGSFNITVS